MGLSAGLCASCILVSPSQSSVIVPADVRLTQSPSDILAYWDLRTAVSGAQDSASMGATLAVTGSTQPTVTLSGPAFPPREIRIDYTTGGARGVAVYRIQLDSGNIILTGTTSASPVALGGGLSVAFGSDANYTVNTNIATATIHQTKIVKWSELTGKLNCDLTDTLSGAGHRYESLGMNAKNPSLYMWTSALANESGVPAIVSGIDFQFELWMIYEIWSQTNSSFARVPWAFSNQSTATQNFIDAFTNGPAAASPYTWGLQRRSNTGAAVSLTSVVKTDQAPRVMRHIVTSSANIGISGRPAKPNPTNLNTGISTNVDRFTLGNVKLGTNPFLVSGWDQSRVTAMVITPPLSADKATLMYKALAA